MGIHRDNESGPAMGTACRSVGDLVAGIVRLGWAGVNGRGDGAVLEGHSDGRAVAITTGVMVMGGLVVQPAVGDAGDLELHAARYAEWAGLDDARGGRACRTGGRAGGIGPPAADRGAFDGAVGGVVEVDLH